VTRRRMCSPAGARPHPRLASPGARRPRRPIRRGRPATRAGRVLTSIGMGILLALLTLGLALDGSLRGLDEHDR
jgi:hypothetical protein